MFQKPEDSLRRPADIENPLYHLLRDNKIEEFNQRRAAGEPADLSGVSLRGLDLRGLHADGLDLSNSYFRQSNLQGLDLGSANLRGASLHDAQISGVLFPDELSAEEIRMSHALGTRLRYR